MKPKPNDKISDYKEPNKVDGSATKKIAIHGNLVSIILYNGYLVF